MRALGYGFFLLSSVVLGCGNDAGGSSAATSSGTGSSSSGSNPTSDIDIVRDARGVPHVFAAKLEDGFYGLGYASAQDRLFQMEFARRFASGHLAEVFGRGAADKNLLHDVRVRTLGYALHDEAVIAALPDDVKKLLDAFAAGVNAWVASSDFVLPPAFATAGITEFEPWKASHSLLMWDRVQEIFGDDMDSEIDRLEKCPGGCAPDPACSPGIDEAAAVVPDPQQASYADPLEGTRTPPRMKASHAWLVAGSRTTTGKPVLHSDPQLAVTTPSFWYEFHISAGGVDARGIGVAGMPATLIGWNEGFATGATAGGGDHTDLYQLALTDDRKKYILDGVEKDFEVRDEVIAISGEAEQTIQVRSTFWGPVVTKLLAKAPVGADFAVRHAELVHADTHSVVAMMRVMMAKDLEGYRAGAIDYIAPGIHGLYAGTDHIAYHHLSAMRKRKTAADGGTNPEPGRLPWDGSKTSQDWGETMTMTERPSVVDPLSGVLFSANHLAVGSWYEKLHGYTGAAGVGDTERSLRLRQIFDAKLGDPNAKMTPAEVLAIHSDSVPAAVTGFRDAIQYLSDQGLLDDSAADAAKLAAAKQKARGVAKALALWSGEAKSSDPITPLSHWLAGNLPYFFRQDKNPALVCQYNGGEGGLCRWLKATTADPASLLTAGSISTDFVIATAALAWDAVAPPGNDDPATWPAEPPRFTVEYQSNKWCPLGAEGSCALDDAQSYEAELDVAEVHTIKSQEGNSYSQLIDFADLQGSRSILPPGVSEDPASPTYKSGVEAWKAGELVPAPLARELIEPTAIGTTTLASPSK